MKALFTALLVLSTQAVSAETIKIHCKTPVPRPKLSRHFVILTQNNPSIPSRERVMLFDAGLGPTTANLRQMQQLNKAKLFAQDIRTNVSGTFADVIYVAVGRDPQGKTLKLRFDLSILDDSGLNLNGTMTVNDLSVNQPIYCVDANLER